MTYFQLYLVTALVSVIILFFVRTYIKFKILKAFNSEAKRVDTSHIIWLDKKDLYYESKSNIEETDEFINLYDKETLIMSAIVITSLIPMFVMMIVYYFIYALYLLNVAALYGQLSKLESLKVIRGIMGK